MAVKPLRLAHAHPRGLLLQHLRPLQVGVPRGRGHRRAAAALPGRAHERRRRARPRCTTSGCARWTSPPPRARSPPRRPARPPASTPSIPAASWAPATPSTCCAPTTSWPPIYDLGVILGCCGAPAYWAGDDARLQARHGARPGGSGRSLGKPTLVFACATCAMMLRVVPARDPPGVALRAAGRRRGAVAPAAPLRRGGRLRPLRRPGRHRHGERPSASWRRAAGVDVARAAREEPLLRPRRPHPRGQSRPLRGDRAAPGGGERQALPRLLRQLPRGVRLAGQGVRPHPGRGLRPGDRTCRCPPSSRSGTTASG